MNIRVQEAGISLQHYSSSYTLKDEYISTVYQVIYSIV